MHRRPSKTTDADIARVMKILEEHNSLRYAVELIDEEQKALMVIAKSIDHPDLEGLIGGLPDILLAPLLVKRIRSSR